MKKKMSREASRTTIFFLVLISILCGIPLFVIIIPYDNFKTQEKKAAPQFDALNEAILAEIEPYASLILLEKYSRGILAPTTLHGRELSLEYNWNGLKIEDILVYYYTQLTGDGWTVQKRYQSGASYYRDDACIEMYIYSPDSIFYVTIWHDYYSQSFSPPVPWWFGWQDGNKTLSYFELVEMYGRVVTCP